jgi:hypothetical protein
MTQQKDLAQTFQKINYKQTEQDKTEAAKPRPPDSCPLIGEAQPFLNLGRICRQSGYCPKSLFSKKEIWERCPVYQTY